MVVNEETGKGKLGRAEGEAVCRLTTGKANGHLQIPAASQTPPASGPFPTAAVFNGFPAIYTMQKNSAQNSKKTRKKLNRPHLRK